MEIEQMNLIKSLESLLGTWTGEGVVEYPTIATVRYRERLTFSMHEGKPYLHFNQRTWRKDEHDNEVPSHWETGFWRVLPEGEIELLSTQASGRIEVAKGNFAATKDGFLLVFLSSLTANDSRVQQTWREFTLNRDRLSYSMKMQMAPVSNLTLHTKAQLNREPLDPQSSASR